MAKPQLEKGFTRIANEILEALSRVNLSPYESRVFWFVVRRTYGFNKKTDRISLSQFEAGTGVKERHVVRAIKSLARKRMIVTHKDGPQSVRYGIQKDYETWLKPLPLQGVPREGLPNEGRTPPYTGSETSTCLGRHKRQKTSSKDNNLFFPIIENTIRRLNELSGKSYRSDSKAITQHLLARLKTGATEADCLAVIEDRWRRWKDKPEMLEHFNPTTLFRPSNFERYLVEARADGERNGDTPPPKIVKDDGDFLELEDGSRMDRRVYEKRYQRPV